MSNHLRDIWSGIWRGFQHIFDQPYDTTAVLRLLWNAIVAIKDLQLRLSIKRRFEVAYSIEKASQGLPIME
jgi:hypothetical protein